MSSVQRGSESGGAKMRCVQQFEQFKTMLAVAVSRLAIVAALLTPVNVAAQGNDWRAVLEGEKARNAQRIAAIEQEGEPIAQELRRINQRIDQHNATGCTYPEGQHQVCAAYDNESAQLNNAQQRVRSQLIPLINELDRLKARNTEIERRLHCVQVPIPCNSDGDCQCSQSCALFPDGRRSDTRICQPSR